ncbi:MAG: hypothetical protein AAB116_09850 [Candidatus Poribacteria bacterium]
MKKSSISVYSIMLFIILTLLILIPMPAQAVNEYKISSSNAGVQIWFEAENFDDRDPGKGYSLTKAEAKLAVPKDTFGGECISPRTNDNSWVMYKFDIRSTGGKRGKWYFWGRIINPNNQSDWLWVIGDPNDSKDIPVGRPAKLADAAANLETHRIFEVTAPVWTWFGGSVEGHDKELQDGENTMFIFRRQSDTTEFWDVYMWSSDLKYTPTDDDYKNAKPMKGGKIAVSNLDKLSTVWGMIKMRH